MHYMTKKIADFIDTLLTFCCTALLGIVCARYFTHEPSAVLLCGAIAGLAVTALIGLGRRKRQGPKQRRDRIERVRHQFIFRSRADSHAYVLRALQKRYDVTDCGDYLRVGKTAVAVCLSAEKLTLARLADLYGSVRGNSRRLLILTACGADKEAESAAETLPDTDTEIFAFDRVYALLQWLDALPPEEIVLKKRKRAGAKALLGQALSRQNAKRYLMLALLMLFSSLFMRFGVYYVVFAALLIVLALLCRIDVLRLLRKKTK